MVILTVNAGFSAWDWSWFGHLITLQSQLPLILSFGFSLRNCFLPYGLNNWYCQFSSVRTYMPECSIKSIVPNRSLLAELQVFSVERSCLELPFHRFSSEHRVAPYFFVGFTLKPRIFRIQDIAICSYRILRATTFF